jgi:type II secretory pathway predicted ATPase ExeA
MYYGYWGLKKPPFDNVPDPTMYAECHASMENAIAETLFAIEEGNECVAVIVGDVGLGKTLSLRIIIDSLDHDKYKIAMVTNPDMSFIELLREIIGQLKGKQCEERRKINLLEIFNKILFETIDSGKKVLIFVDEANAMSPANLESLRLLTNMQDDQRNLFTLVLAGQLELARRLEHPKRANLLQRIGTFSRIDKLETEDLIKTYVETRLSLAGGARTIFADDAYGFLWEYSDNGVPRLINKICKLSLKAGETNQFSHISGEVVRQIGERFRHLAGPAIQKRKPRKRVESKAAETLIEEETGIETVDSLVLSVEPFVDRRRPVEMHEVEPEVDAEAVQHVSEPVEVQEPVAQEAPVKATPEAVLEAVVVAETQKPPEETVVPQETIKALEEPADKKEIVEELKILDVQVTITIPYHMVEQGRSSTHEHRLKMAGALAAQVLKKHPELVSASEDDPISVWSDIREFVVEKLK